MVENAAKVVGDSKSIDKIASMTGTLCNEETLSNHKHAFRGWEQHACEVFLGAWNKALRGFLRDREIDNIPELVEGFCGMMNIPEGTDEKKAAGRSGACWNVTQIDPNDVNIEEPKKKEVDPK